MLFHFYLVDKYIFVYRKNFENRLNEFQNRFWFLQSTHLDRELGAANRDIMESISRYRSCVNLENEKLAELQKSLENIKKELKIIRAHIDENVT